MAAMTFRFTTECEVTLEGSSYQDIYLQFKEFMHGNQQALQSAQTVVYPPESVQLYFHTDREQDFNEIPLFKGDYQADIQNHCDPASLH